MQINDVNGVNNVKDAVSFDMEVNSMTFKLLSGMYENPIDAIIREVICNSIDSHIEAGNEDREINVYLPNIANQKFVVEDFGVGMSHETVMEIFSKYSASTKRESNELIGGFGIGAKAPFAYKNSFQIESRYEGVKRVYLCFLNEKSVPHIKLLTENRVEDLENGVTFSLNLKETSHVYEFERKALDIVKYLEANIVVHKNGEILSYAQDLLDDEVFHYSTSKSAISVLCGGVLYGIGRDNISKIEQAVQEELELDRSINFGFGMRIIVRCEIGEVLPLPTREALEVDEKTINNISEKICNAFYEVYDEYLEEYKNDEYTISKRRENKTSPLRFYEKQIRISFDNLFNNRIYDVLKDEEFDIRNSKGVRNNDLNTEYARKKNHLYINSLFIENGSRAIISCIRDGGVISPNGKYMVFPEEFPEQVKAVIEKYSILHKDFKVIKASLPKKEKTSKKPIEIGLILPSNYTYGRCSNSFVSDFLDADKDNEILVVEKNFEFHSLNKPNKALIVNESRNKTAIKNIKNRYGEDRVKSFHSLKDVYISNPKKYFLDSIGKLAVFSYIAHPYYLGDKCISDNACNFYDVLGLCKSKIKKLRTFFIFSESDLRDMFPDEVSTCENIGEKIDEFIIENPLYKYVDLSHLFRDNPDYVIDELNVIEKELNFMYDGEVPEDIRKRFNLQ